MLRLEAVIGSQHIIKEDISKSGDEKQEPENRDSNEYRISEESDIRI